VTTTAVLGSAIAECRANGVRFRAQLAWHPTVEAIKLGFPFFTGVLLLMPVELAAQTLLVRWHGINTLGDIRTAVALTSTLAFIPAALNAPLVSMFAAADASSPRLALMRAVQSMKALWLFAMAVSLSLLAVWREMVLLLFGRAYHDALTYGSLSVVLTLFMIIITPFYNLLLAQKRTGTLLVAALLRAVIMLGVAALLLKPLGVAGLWLAQMLSAVGGLVAVSIAAFAGSRESDPASRSAVIWMWGGLAVVSAFGVLEAFTPTSALLEARLAVLLLSLPILYVVSARVFSKDEVLLLIHRFNSLKVVRPS
jgi:O-antigen/teichoic acid export membrane protein